MLKKTAIPLLALAVALAGLALVYRAGHPLEVYLFNSDALYLPTVFTDVLGRGGHLPDWFLTPAPYFFPDFPLFSIAYLFGKGPFEQIFIFGILQIVLTMLALRFIAKACVNGHALASASLIAVILVWLGAHGIEPYVDMLVSAFHFGGFLSGLVFVALWLHADLGDDTSSRRWTMVCMCLLAFLTSMSDNLFLVQTTVPFVATLLLMSRGKGFDARRRAAAGAVLLTSVAGSFCYKFVVNHNTRYATKLSMVQVSANAHGLLDIVSGLFKAQPLVALVFAVYVCIGIACIAGRFDRRILRQMPTGLATLITFSMLSMMAMLAAIMLVSNLPPSPRYLIPMLVWPIVVIVLLISHILGKKVAWPASALSALLALSLVAMAMRLPQPATTEYYPEQIACIDKALAGKSLEHGIAEYWDAKRIQAFSHHKLALAQYFSDLTSQKWITSDRFYRSKYDFAIIAEDAEPMYKLPVEMLTTLNGAPKETVSCGTRKVLIYGADQLRTTKISEPGSAYTWRGCDLPKQIGKATAACESEKADPDQEGFVTFGPYEALPAGEYGFEITYASSKPEGEDAGKWDVVLALPTEARPLAAGAFIGTAGQTRSASGKFVIEKNFDLTKIEIRSFSNKGGTMKVVSLRVTRTR